MKVVVIGAGSVGAHVGYRLAEQGAEVTVVDAGEPGQGTTAASIAWLSEFPQRTWPEEPGKARLRETVHDVFHRVHEEVPGDYVRWTGTLLWDLPEERDRLVDAAAVAQQKGVDVRVLDGRSAREIEPCLAIADDETVFWEPGTGWVDGPAAVAALLDAAAAHGAKVLTGVGVVALDLTETSARVTTSTGETIDADAVVNAAGSWGSHVAALADLAVPLDLVPGRVVYTQPVTNGPSTVVNAPAWCARPDPSGGLAVHWRGGPQEPGHGANARTTQQVVDEVASVIPELRGTSPVRSNVGIRPIPPGGPIVGRLPWLPTMYFTLSHGGIGWGPMWALLTARELLAGETVPELTAMRPERFYLPS